MIPFKRTGVYTKGSEIPGVTGVVLVRALLNVAKRKPELKCNIEVPSTSRHFYNPIEKWLPSEKRIYLHIFFCFLLPNPPPPPKKKKTMILVKPRQVYLGVCVCGGGGVGVGGVMVLRMCLSLCVFVNKMSQSCKVFHQASYFS